MSKEAEIIKLLADATASGKQKWEPTAVEENFVTAVGDGFTANIMSSDDPQNPSDPDYTIDLRDQEGRVIFSVFNTIEGFEYKDLRALHYAARRSALKVDETLDAILKVLKPK